MSENKRGKLIVIEGIDGSGKATQSRRLVERLRQEGQRVETFAFPRHEQNFFGVLVDQYLNNEFGNATKFDPRITSLLYACDRWEVKDLLNSWLGDGKFVILDRYATSNMGHQACKLGNVAERDKFLDWLDELEFRVFKIPRPDVTIFLDVEVEVVRDLIDSRSSSGKEYINGSHDAHEADKNHLVFAREAYSYVCDKYDYWQRVKCTENGKLLSIDEIHDKVWEMINKYL